MGFIERIKKAPILQRPRWEKEATSVAGMMQPTLGSLGGARLNEAWLGLAVLPLNAAVCDHVCVASTMDLPLAPYLLLSHVGPGRRAVCAPKQ